MDHQQKQLADGGDHWPDLHADALWCLYAEDDVFVRTLVAEPYLIELFTKQLNTRIAGMYAPAPPAAAPKPYREAEVVKQLKSMANRNGLPRLRSEAGKVKQKAGSPSRKRRPKRPAGEPGGLFDAG